MNKKSLPTVHCLTTLTRQDRHTQIIQQSVEQGFALRFFIGERPEQKRDVKKAIVKGHKSIVQYAKDNKMPFCVIAEDDIIFFAHGAYKFFIDNKPTDYDLWMAVIYSGEIQPETFRVMNGFSGGMSLYCIHERFYDFVLNEIPDDCHIDRELGNTCFKNKYFQCNPIVGHQSGGYSDNLKTTMFYGAYLEGRQLYNGE